MMNCEEFIESGILELYIMGDTTPEQDAEVLHMSAQYPAVAEEIQEISNALEKYALDFAKEPDPVIKPFLLATIDYMDRLKDGEPFILVPPMTASSTIEEHEEWIMRPDMTAPEDFEGIYAKILSATPELTTALVWLREMAPQEVHDNEYERFLILEGTCDIIIEQETHSLQRGDFLQIPLHKNHHVRVTSLNPCKILLQRVAA